MFAVEYSVFGDICCYCCILAQQKSHIPTVWVDYILHKYMRAHTQHTQIEWVKCGFSAKKKKPKNSSTIGL